MTNFLSRLAERSSGHAAVAHPVVPPLFAAGPPVAAAPAEDASWGGAPPAGEPDAARGESPREPGDRSAVPGSRDGAAVSEPTAHAALPDAALPQAPPLQGAGRVALPGPRRTRVIAAEGGVFAEPHTEGAPTAEDGSPLVPSLATREPSPPLVPLRSRAARSLTRTATAAPDAAHAAPIVHISIGRIDVRAVPPSKPAAPAVPPVRKEPALSLEEYLRPRDRRP